MKTKISLRYILLTLLAVLFTWAVHEFAHWCTGELLGYDMGLTLNTAFPIDETYESFHADLVSAAGPIITIIQAFLVFFLLAKRPVQDLFPFLFTPFYMRTVAGIINFFSLNDEGRVSHSLGLGSYTLPIIVSAILFLLVMMISKKWMYSRSFILWTTVLVIIFSSILILTDQAYSIRIF